MNQKKKERASLILSSIASFSITIIGLYCYFISNIKVLFLDCILSFVALFFSLTAIIITKISKQKTKTYPQGLYFLEPLYSILKSLVILIISIFSLISSLIKLYNYLIYKIEIPINIEIGITYIIFTIILCFSLSIFQKNQNKKINNTSTILTTESKANKIEGFQSLGIGISFFLLMLINKNGKLGFLYYTMDSIIIIILVLITIKEPIKIIIDSFKELTNGILNNTDIVSNINELINNDLYCVNKEIKIYKIGTKININIKINDNIKEELVNKIQKSKQELLKILSFYYENIEIIFII